MSPKESQSHYNERWHDFLTTGANDLEKRGRRLFRHLPESPRCKSCYAPFKGIGAPLIKLLLGKYQSAVDPRFCNHCTDFMRDNPGGAEIEITMLFADVRGSTTVAEELSPGDFSRFINRFYKETTDVLMSADALIDRLIGDEVVGIFVPGIAGPEHASKGFQAAQELLEVTGHAEEAGPWVPVGAGVHTGVSYVGTVGSTDGAMDLTALGDVPNVAARLASLAEPGEVIASQAVCTAANANISDLEKRRLQLKGRAETIEACVLRVGSC